MCYIVVERYAACRCLYHEHSVDMCPAHGTRGHTIQEKTVFVGYACENHSAQTDSHQSSSSRGYSDSGYGTASRHSQRHSSHRHRR